MFMRKFERDASQGGGTATKVFGAVAWERRLNKPTISGGDRQDEAETAARGRAEPLRLRAAWMYYVEQMTQNDIAEVLGVGRVSVARMLAEARTRNEVRISVTAQPAELIGLERALERRFDIERAIVAPLSQAGRDPTLPISAAVGDYLSQVVQSGMTIGLGWGRTLLQSLPFMNERTLDNLKVISLLGGVAQVRRFNPAEYVWRFAQAFGGDGYLLAAPAVVDSAQTKATLIEKCGLASVIDMADALDLAVVSVGGIQDSTAFRVGYLSEDLRLSLSDAGAVGDLLFHFFDREGRMIDHPLNERVISVGIDRIRNARQRVLASGGADKLDALRGGIAIVRPTVLVTDEVSARGLLEPGDTLASPPS